MFKVLYNALILHTSKVMLNILQASSQQYVNQELPDVQADFKEAEEPEIKQSVGSWKKQETSKKASTSASLTALNPFTVWITTNCGKLLKRWDYLSTLSTSWETCMQFKKQQLESDMEQWTGSKLGKEYVKAVYLIDA